MSSRTDLGQSSLERTLVQSCCCRKSEWFTICTSSVPYASQGELWLRKFKTFSIYNPFPLANSCLLKQHITLSKHLMEGCGSLVNSSSRSGLTERMTNIANSMLSIARVFCITMRLPCSTLYTPPYAGAFPESLLKSNGSLDASSSLVIMCDEGHHHHTCHTAE